TPFGVLLAEPGLFQCALGQRGHRHLVYFEGLQRTVLERVRGVADLGVVALGELVGVHDDRSPAGDVANVRFQRCRIHRDQHIGAVSGGENVVVGEVDLEAGDTGDRSLRRTDLGREVRQRGEVVTERGGFGGESVTGQLHAVAGVAREADYYSVELRDGVLGCSSWVLVGRVLAGA